MQQDHDDPRVQQAAQQAADALGEALGQATGAPVRPAVPLKGLAGVQQEAALQAQAELEELEVTAAVTQAWVRELIRKDRHLQITAVDIRCLQHALKAIGLVAGR